MSEAAGDSELWMVPYADLMSTLVILFLALYGYAALRQDAEKKKAEVRSQRELAVTEEEKKLAEAREREAALAAELEKAVHERLPADAAALRVDADRIRLTLASPLLFDSGSADLRPGIRPFLDVLAAALRGLPNEVLVEGHTDALPIRSGRYPTNWELSAGRAFAVVEGLVRRGLSPQRFWVYGYGEHRPVDSNATRAGRAKNRRIEISLLRTKDEG